MQISFVNIFIAFAGGLLSFLSPCVLPLVPGYISLMSGISIDHLKNVGSGARRAVIFNSLVGYWSARSNYSAIFTMLLLLQPLGATGMWLFLKDPKKPA